VADQKYSLGTVSVAAHRSSKNPVGRVATVQSALDIDRPHSDCRHPCPVPANWTFASGHIKRWCSSTLWSSPSCSLRYPRPRSGALPSVLFASPGIARVQTAAGLPSGWRLWRRTHSASKYMRQSGPQTLPNGFPRLFASGVPFRDVTSRGSLHPHHATMSVFPPVSPRSHTTSPSSQLPPSPPRLQLQQRGLDSHPKRASPLLSRHRPRPPPNMGRPAASQIYLGTFSKRGTGPLRHRLQRIYPPDLP
jgi:hypothetical protein